MPMDNYRPSASSGVGGVSVFTTVGAAPMGAARNQNNKDRLARMKQKRKMTSKDPEKFKGFFQSSMDDNYKRFLG